MSEIENVKWHMAHPLEDAEAAFANLSEAVAAFAEHDTSARKLYSLELGHVASFDGWPALDKPFYAVITDLARWHYEIIDGRDPEICALWSAILSYVSQGRNERDREKIETAHRLAGLLVKLERKELS